MNMCVCIHKYARDITHDNTHDVIQNTTLGVYTLYKYTHIHMNMCVCIHEYARDITHDNTHDFIQNTTRHV